MPTCQTEAGPQTGSYFLWADRNVLEQCLRLAQASDCAGSHRLELFRGLAAVWSDSLSSGESGSRR